MVVNLPLRELQSLIGEGTLERLERIIPYISDSAIKHPSDIYKHRNLVKIYFSFSGQDSFYSKQFRKSLLRRLSDAEIRNLAKLLSIDESPPFNELVEKISNISWAENEETAIFLHFFDLPENYVPSPSDKLPPKELIEKPYVPYKTLKDFQLSIFMDSLEQLKIPYKNFLIQMPTGSGKTRTSMEIICNVMNENPGKSVIWLANSEELCEQAVECFKDVWCHIGLSDIEVIRAWGSGAVEVPTQSAFVVASFQKLHRAFKANAMLAEEVKKHVALVIVDEAHQAIAPTYLKVITALMHRNYDAHLIGLTATPGRSSEITGHSKESAKLAELFDTTKLEIDSQEKTVFQYLRERKVLAKVKTDPLITGLIFNLTDEEKEYVLKFCDFSPEFIARISEDDIRNLEIINKLKRECAAGKRILFFGGSVEHSKFICALLNFLGYAAEHLDGTTRKDRRRCIISDFKEGNLQVICNYGILTTGFDAPKTDVVFIARPTLSVVLYSQMVGRGLRGPAIGGTEECKVIDVIDNIANFQSPDLVYDYFEQYWERHE